MSNGFTSPGVVPVRRVRSVTRRFTTWLLRRKGHATEQQVKRLPGGLHRKVEARRCRLPSHDADVRSTLASGEGNAVGRPRRAIRTNLASPRGVADLWLRCCCIAAGDRANSRSSPGWLVAVVAGGFALPDAEHSSPESLTSQTCQSTSTAANRGRRPAAVSKAWPAAPRHRLNARVFCRADD